MKKMNVRRIGLTGSMIMGLLLFLALFVWAQSSPPVLAKSPAATTKTPATAPTPTHPPAEVSPPPAPSHAAVEVQPSLSTLPDKAEWGGSLAISANQDNAFDLQPGNNEVTFRMPETKEKPEKAVQVSPDGRTILVQVPMQALSGLVRVENKKKNKNYGPVDLNIIAGKVQGGVSSWWVLLPALFYLGLLLLIWHYIKNFSLGSAMSEQVEQKVLHLDPSQAVVYNPTTHDPVYDFKYVDTSSASRLIAFLGFLTLIVWFLAMLIPALYWFGRTGEVPNMSNLSTFLAAQAAVFAPYIANKLASAISK